MSTINTIDLAGIMQRAATTGAINVEDQAALSAFTGKPFTGETAEALPAIFAASMLAKLQARRAELLNALAEVDALEQSLLETKGGK